MYLRKRILPFCLTLGSFAGWKRERWREGKREGWWIRVISSGGWVCCIPELREGEKERWNVTQRERKREDLSGGTLKGQERTRKKEPLAKGKKKFSKRTRGGKERGRAGNKFCAVIGGGDELKSLNVLSVKGRMGNTALISAGMVQTEHPQM